jgi:hypothetical protein
MLDSQLRATAMSWCSACVIVPPASMALMLGHGILDALDSWGTVMPKP